MTKLRHSPDTPDKLDAEVRSTVANLENLAREYRRAYQLGYNPERRGGDKVRTSTSDPTGSTVEGREGIRSQLSVVSDLIGGKHGARGQSAEALGKVRNILEHGRLVMRDWELQRPRHPNDRRRTRDGSYGAPSPAEMETLRARQRARGVEV